MGLRQLDVQLNIACFSDTSTGGSTMSNPNLGNSLGIYYQNVRGLGIKQHEFYDSVCETNFDIICLSETWLNDQRYNHKYNVFEG
jgi:hypothetical protein